MLFYYYFCCCFYWFFFLPPMQNPLCPDPHFSSKHGRIYLIGGRDLPACSHRSLVSSTLKNNIIFYFIRNSLRDIPNCFYYSSNLMAGNSKNVGQVLVEYFGFYSKNNDMALGIVKNKGSWVNFLISCLPQQYQLQNRGIEDFLEEK